MPFNLSYFPDYISKSHLVSLKSLISIFYSLVFFFKHLSIFLSLK